MGAYLICCGSPVHSAPKYLQSLISIMPPTEITTFLTPGRVMPRRIVKRRGTTRERTGCLTCRQRSVNHASYPPSPGSASCFIDTHPRKEEAMRSWPPHLQRMCSTELPLSVGGPSTSSGTCSGYFIGIIAAPRPNGSWSFPTAAEPRSNSLLGGRTCGLRQPIQPPPSPPLLHADLYHSPHQ